MKKSIRFPKAALLAAMLVLSSTFAVAQLNVKITITQVSTNIPDCDGAILFINTGSDPNFSWTGAGAVNNVCYDYGCPNNGACATQATNLLLYDNSFACPGSVPATINWDFKGCENDNAVGCVAGLSVAICDGNSALGAHSVPAPTAPGTFNYSFTSTSAGGSCPGDYSYNVQVVATGSFPPAVPDLICNAQNLPVDGVIRNYAWCGSYGIEPGEYANQAGWPTLYGSGWFVFTAPPSGSVAIETNNSATSIGTAFVVYHAADGAGCGTGHGISPSGVVLKRKFDYLSSYDDADDDIPIINPNAAAAIDMNSCSNLFADGHDLVPGETYYIQITSDQPSDLGNIAIRIRDLGGNGSDLSDIPCRGNNVGTLTAAPSNVSLSHGCSTSYELTGNSGSHAYTYTSVNNGINQSNWVQFVAPNSGAAIVTTDVPLLGESSALYAYDSRFAPGRPADYDCANLVQTQYEGNSATLGGASAQYTAYCLEPGYTYYTLGDPTSIALSSTTNYTLRDPTSQAPGNDILCLAMQNAAYNVPVQLLGQAAPAAVNGTNLNACIERLAGEQGFLNTADKTVWHYFTAPPSGVVDVSVTTGTIGYAAFAVYRALNGTSCYGGLSPATFTLNGTPTTPRITALGTAAGSGNVVSQVCCLAPGQTYVVQIDGGTTLSEGTYSIRIGERNVQAGATSYTDNDGDTYTAASPVPALICAGESITANATGAILPVGGCLSEGYLLHNTANPIPPYSALTVYQTATPGNYFFLNNGTAPYNQVIYVSALADNTATWGGRCPSARIRDAVPVVFLQAIAFNNININACGRAAIAVSGGKPAYDGSTFNYTVSPANQIAGNASGTVAQNGVITFTATQAGNYTIYVQDAEGCFHAQVVNIPSVAAATANISTTGNSICVGDNATLTASGANTYVWNTGANTNTLQVTTAGTYTVTATSAAGCTASSSAIVTLRAAATPPIIALISPLCTVGNAQLDAGAGYTAYAWSTGSPIRTATVTASGNYTVTVTNNVGCTATAVYTVAPNANPNAPAIVANAPLCGTNGFITLNAGTGYTNYNWSNNTTAQPTTTITQAGTYTVTVSNALNCTATATFAVTQENIPTTPLIAQSTPLCSNSTGSIAVNAAVGGQTYAWNTGATTATIATTTAGIYTVTTTNAAGCKATATAAVAQFSAPIPPALAPTYNVCAGGNVSINATGNYAAYAWNTGATTPIITINTANTLTVTVTDAIGCKATASTIVDVYALPIAPSINTIGALCSNQCASLESSTGYASFSWSNGSSVFNTLVCDAGTYTVTVTNFRGCTITTSKTITKNTAPLPPLVTVQPQLCAGSAATLTVQGSFTNYNWNNTAATPAISVTSAGLYTVTVTDTNNCTATNTVNVITNAAPTKPIIGMDGLFCLNSSANLVASAGYSNYQWSGTSGSSTQTQTITTAGTYTVTVTNLAGCTNTASFAAQNKPLPATPTIAVTRPLCVGKATQLVAQGGYTSYIWTGNVSGQTDSIATAGVYTVTVTGQNGCTNTNSKTVAQELPTLVSFVGTMFFCEGATTPLSTNKPFSAYQWSSGATTQSIVITQTGTYTVTATETNGCTGTAAATITKVPLPMLNAGADRTVYPNEVVQLVATSNASFPTYVWTGAAVSNSDIPNPTATPTETATYIVSILDSYNCVASDEVTITVLDFLDCLQPDEGFTPNGDTKNDTWQIPCLLYFEPNTVSVYNRYGQLLFDATNYKGDWDGSVAGKPLPDGTYYYVVTLTGGGKIKRRLYKGTVTIVR